MNHILNHIVYSDNRFAKRGLLPVGLVLMTPLEESINRLKATCDSTPVFGDFPKMARWSREAIITEKIDGTNASVHVHQVSTETIHANGGLDYLDPCIMCWEQSDGTTLKLYAGARNGFIMPKVMAKEGFQDNYGFASWVLENAKELFKLGVGSHFGEWWGSGIQRSYGLPKGEKRFSLFNVGRWWDCHGAAPEILPDKMEISPTCCHVVPILKRCPFDDSAFIRGAFDVLRTNGSIAAPGFMRPEGIIIWHVAGNFGMKKTIERDEMPKSVADRR